MRIPACARALGVSVALSVTAACGGGGGSSSSDPAVVLHTTSVPNGQTGVAYATSFDASFSHPPGRYIKVSGQLPPGLELDQVTGELTGYPRQLGTFRFEIEARDGVDPDAPRDVTFPADRKRYSLLITKGPPNFIPPFTLPSAEYRAPYSHVLDIAGGTPPYRCEKLGGELPNGLSVATNCTVGNFPTAARQDPYVFQVRVTDADGNTDVETFSVRVVILPLLVGTTDLPEAAVDFPYEYQFELSSPGGGSPWAWSQVPPTGAETDLAALGMEITPQGVLRSKPSVAGPTSVGTFTFKVQVVDQAGQIAPNPQRTFSLTVNPGPVLQRITPDKEAAGGPYVVTGLNFRDGATLTFADGTTNAQTIETTFVSETELRFDEAPSVFGASGYVPVRVRNPDGGSHVKLNAFAYPAATFAFDSTARVPVPNSALSSTGVDVADVNGDGFGDIVHTGTNSSGWSNASGSAGGLEVLINAPPGGVFDPSNPTFTKVTVASGDFHQVRFSDQNSDGRPDIVAVGSFGGTRQVHVYLNQSGTGGAAFTAGMSRVITSLPTQGSATGHVSDIDLGRMRTNDQIPDLAYVYQDPPGLAPVQGYYSVYYAEAGNTVATLEGLGNGTFGSANLKTGTDIFELFTAAGVAAGDFDEDSRADLYVSDGSNHYSWMGTQGAMGVYAFTDTSGIFGEWSPMIDFVGPSQYTESLGTDAGDVTGDGCPDVVVSTGVNYQDNDINSPWYGLPSVTAFASGGDGTFSQLSLFRDNAIIYRYNVVFDGDFDLALDVAATGGDFGSFNKVDVLQGSGSGLGFVTQLSASVGSPNIGRVAAGDLNGDGKTDLIACLSMFADSQLWNYVGQWPSAYQDRGDGSTKGVVFFLNASN